MRLTNRQNKKRKRKNSGVRQLESALQTPKAYGTTTCNAYTYLWRNEHSVFRIDINSPPSPLKKTLDPSLVRVSITVELSKQVMSFIRKSCVAYSTYEVT
jgi:hypothetical protein